MLLVGGEIDWIMIGVWFPAFPSSVTYAAGVLLGSYGLWHLITLQSDAGRRRGKAP